MPSEISLFELLPPVMQEGDPFRAAQAFLDSALDMLKRTRMDVGGLLMLVDPSGINTTFIFSSQPRFAPQFSPEQLLTGQVTSRTTVVVRTPQMATDDFFTGYTLRALRTEEQSGVVSSVGGEVVKVVSFDAATQTLTVAPPFSTTTASDVGFEVAQPGYVYLPATDSEGRSINAKRDWYVGYYVRVVGGPGSDPIQTRTIVGYEVIRDSNKDPIAYRLSVDRPWDLPPVSTSFVGITTSFVDLAYLARLLGYEVDATDPEPLQKAQIRSAARTYKVKGTIQAYQILCRAFGFSANVTTLYSDPTHEEKEEPGVPEPQRVVTSVGPKIGRPAVLDSVATVGEFFDDFDDLSAWTSTATFSGGSLVVSAGQAQLNVSGGSNSSGAEVHLALTTPLDKGVVVETSLTIYGTLAGSDELDVLRFTDEEVSPAYITLSVRYLSATTYALWIRGPNITAADTGVILNVGQRHKLKIRLLDNTSSSAADGIVQVYVDDTLTYNVRASTGQRLFDGKGIDGFSLYVRSDSGSPSFAAQVLFDWFSVLLPTDTILQRGGGEDESWGLTHTIGGGTNAGLRTPDSEIQIFLRRIHPQVKLDADAFLRVVRRLEVVRPIHIQIGVVGVLFDETEVALAEDDLTKLITLPILDEADASDLLELFAQFFPIYDDAEAEDDLVVVSDGARWTVTGDRWTTGGARWNRGT